MQVVRVVISFDEIEVEQRCVTVGFELIPKCFEALIQVELIQNKRWSGSLKTTHN